MRCKEAYKFICDNLDQSVDSPECIEIRRHIEECPNCSAYLDSLKKTIGLYRMDPRAQKVPVTVHRRLMKIVQLKTEALSRDGKPPRSKTRK